MPAGPLIPIAEVVGFYVYRLFDNDRRLLYVGQSSTSMGARLASHLRQTWWPDVAFLSVQRCDSREELARTEALAIEREKPIHNKDGHPRQMALWPKNLLDRRRRLTRSEKRVAHDEVLLALLTEQEKLGDVSAEDRAELASIRRRQRRRAGA